jgi:hypothetical protein
LKTRIYKFTFTEYNKFYLFKTNTIFKTRFNGHTKDSIYVEDKSTFIQTYTLRKPRNETNKL